MDAIAASAHRLATRACAYLPFDYVCPSSPLKHNVYREQEWDWSELFTASPGRFVFAIGRTPLSDAWVPLAVSIGYVLTLFFVQHSMTNREAFQLKAVSACHNLFLCFLSLVMVCGVTVGAWEKVAAQGWYSGLFCESDPDYVRGTMYFWGYIFYLSKIWELIDSYLLALRKKPLIILHVYHHMVMVWVCWCGLHGKWGMSLWVAVFFNGSVHVAMYYYYFISIVHRPPAWAKYLTKVQIMQFVLGVFLTVWFLSAFVTRPRVHWAGYLPVIEFTPGCTGETWAVVFMSSVNFSFLLLFLQFFFQKYSRQVINSVRTHASAAKSAASKKVQ